MRQFFLVWLCTFLSLTILAQTGNDSLKKQMSAGNSYEIRIKAYLAWLGDYEQLKKLDEVLLIGDEAMALARSNGDSVSVGIIDRNIGVANYFKGRYDIAAQHYYRSIANLENGKDKKQLALTLNDLAKLYRKTKDLDRSLENYEKALAIFRSLKDDTGISMIMNESGVVFEYKKDYEEAIRRYKAGLEINKAKKDSVGISYSLNFLAGVYTLQEKFADAEKLLQEVIAIRSNLKDTFGLALAYTDIGAMYNAKGDYTKAAQNLEQSNAIAQQIGYPELMSSNFTELSAIAQKQGNYQKALDYYKQRTNLRDSIFNLEKTKQVEELNSKYESVKKQQKIDEQHNRIVRQNFLFLGLAGLALLIALLVHSQYKRYRLKKEAQLQAEIMKQQELASKAVIEAEENERQRIAKDLHDGVGQMMSAAKMNLSAFESELKFDNKEQKASFERLIQLVDDGCKEVRTVSHIMMPNALLKNNLAAAIQDFTDKLDKKSLKVHLFTEGLEERLDTNVETVLYRVLQETVTNVIKHAGATTLDISIIKDKEGINATIEDNGKGFDTTDKEKFEGIGLRNIITRIGYLKGTVDFDSAPGRGTVVALHVPL
jgi:two-component system NarL family sensor kinase